MVGEVCDVVLDYGVEVSMGLDSGVAGFWDFWVLELLGSGDGLYLVDGGCWLCGGQCGFGF